MIARADDGTELAFSAVGDGPDLLMIAGGGGTGARYGALAAALSDSFRVLTYDRRCCGASGGDREATVDLVRQARDAAAVLVASGAKRAHVFGNSGGASIALKLAEERPDLVDAVIAHEPPVLAVLPDGAELVEWSDGVAACCSARGLMPALGMFMTKVEGVNGPPPGPRPSPEDLAFFLTLELPAICRYAPDPARLGTVALTFAAGRDSGNAYYVRSARALAKSLGAPFVEVEGNHFSYADQPEAFAALIRVSTGAPE